MYGHLSTRLLPDNYPQFFSSAKGTHIKDVDGKQYLDFMCAFGTNLFGYADEEIDSAYTQRMAQGDTFAATELVVDLAEEFTSMVSNANWALFCKNGSDATSTALLVARAHTGKEKVVVARGAYHGTASWATERAAGVTQAEQSDRILCDYNDIASLEEAVARAEGNLAAIFATPFKHDIFVDQQRPNVEYAKRARELCDRTGALLVVDDVRAGFRTARDCSWSTIGVDPDMSAWGKCIANGHPISALLGSDKVKDTASEVYVAGSFWCQSAPMAAALITLRRIRSSRYLERLNLLGEALRKGLAAAAAQHGIGFRQSGPPTMPLFLFDDDPDLRKGFFWSGEMLRLGVYVHPWHNMFLNAAMTAADMQFAVSAAEEAFAGLRRELPKLPPNAKMRARAPELRMKAGAV
jgi:glutamate-1-semialdehyde 2,1-aminomutase